MTTASASDWRQEGEAKFAITGAFYRPKSKIARDLAILAANLYRLKKWAITSTGRHDRLWGETPALLSGVSR